MIRATPLRAALVLAAFALLAGCGIKGGLERPAPMWGDRDAAPAEAASPLPDNDEAEDEDAPPLPEPGPQ